MVNYIIAAQLGGKKVITAAGKEIGHLDDLVIDDVSGKIEAILVEPDPAAKGVDKYSSTEDGKLIIPYMAVGAIKDVVVVDEKKLT